ncbi:MAG: polyprenyltransferase [Gammaproteobacteria bacterium]|nr:polyprenyltransferase [Gammaproteobacteria bacterium]
MLNTLTSLTARWPDYLALCKPRIVALIVFTAIVGMLLSTPGMVPLRLLILASLGIWLAAASAAVINQVVDQKIDSEMLRTQSRPLVRGSVSSASASLFAMVLGTASMLILTFYVNVLTSLLTLFSLIGYGFIYSMYLKRATPQNIVIGGVAGAAPPVLGWTAITNNLDPQSLLLFLIIFAWTPPHFWALAIFRRKEYATVNIPMLPVTHGVEFTRKYILLYTIVLCLISLLPYLTMMCGPVYLFGAIALGLGFLYHAVRMQVDHSDSLAMRTFSYSILYLAVLFTFLILDHYIPLVVREM